MELEDSQYPSGMPILSLFEAAASTNPTPGGGSVSAVCGYLGVALLLKAIRISARKKPTEFLFVETEEELIRISDRLTRLSRADSEAFDQYMKALKLPKVDEAEKVIRSQSLRDASIAATEVALDILEAGNAVLKCSAQVLEEVLPTIRADVRAGIEFASAMNIVARENAKANLSGLPHSDALQFRLAVGVEQHRQWIRNLGIGM